MLRCCATRRPRDKETISTAAASTPASRGGRAVGSEALGGPSAATRYPDASIRKDSSEVSKAFIERVLTKPVWEGGIGKKLPVHIPAAVKTFADAVDADSVMDGFLMGANSGATTAFKRGEPCMRENIYLAYLEGATLSLHEAEQYSQALLELCQGLAPYFSYATSDLILEAPDTTNPPFQPEGDVFLIQLWGSRRASVFRTIKGLLPVSAPRPKALLECELRAGDVLYVPYGFEVRSPECSQEPTLAVALSVRSSNQNLGNALATYMNDLLRGDMSESTDSFFRRAVTKHTLRDASESERRAIDEDVRKSAAELISKVSASALRKHFAEKMEKLCKEQAENAAKNADRARWLKRQLNPVSTTDGLRVARGIRCKCAPGDATAHFQRGAEVLRLPIQPSASYMLHQLSDGDAHKLASLQCQDPIERICVAQVLVFKDCLEVCSMTEDSKGSSMAPESAGPFSAYCSENHPRNMQAAGHASAVQAPDW
eukprot:TRINITY_DN8269_c0_g1_i1.p1 TRINITY_DN8269_c0_g1~~TRINITY_DN8269_c0_g1_i1.p1  ORF type:complete len:517 (+),score=75.83 TRINITY_DN8269_c0_g1_i1:93-1553(+)